MGDRWPQQTWAEKSGRGSTPFGGARSPSNSMWPRVEAYFPTKWHLDPSSRLATIDMGRKLGTMPLLGGGGTPSNTMSPGPRPTSLPSGTLIHPAVWPQQTWAENWGLCPFGEGEPGPHLTQCGQGRGLHACQVSS